MGYKMKSSVAKIIIENGLVEKKALPPGIQGVTYNDGTIAIDKILRGDLSYDDENIYWKGKKYPRKNMKEGFPKLEWEAEAYKKQSKK